jgi:hypothetical protein
MWVKLIRFLGALFWSPRLLERDYQVDHYYSTENIFVSVLAERLQSCSLSPSGYALLLGIKEKHI